MNYTYVIVDDDEAFVTLLKHQLSFLGNMEFLAAYSHTISAAPGIEKHKPDIVFLDIEVDVLTGFDVLKVIKTDAKIIVVSSSLAYKKQAEAYNVHDFIQKPISSLERLKESIDRIDKKS